MNKEEVEKDVKMNKKGTITSRTLEKLGWLRFRSHSQPDVEGKSQDQHEGVDRTASVTTITGGELDITEKYHRRSLKERVLGYKQEEKQSTAKFYLDDTSPTMVTTATGAELDSSGSVQSPKQEKKKGKVQPEGTNEYIVKDSDTLEKIAAHFDTTPSELKKLNKLMTSAMIFSGQVLFVPDKEYEKSACSSLSMSDETNSQSSSVFGSVPDRPTMDTPLIKAVNSSPTRIPGHAERQTPVSSPKDLLEYEVMVPHKLTEDEAEQLDKDCMERFIKLNVKHITDGQGVVKGVLLVTPNAVMFDPDVSDPLVLEHGHEKYGMIAPMDLIISAAMYHDISAMKQRGKKRDDGTSYPRPEVYHDKSCPMAKQKLEESQQSSKGLNSIPERLHNILRNPLNKSDSVCSCGQGSTEVELDDTPEVFDTETKPFEDIGSASDALSKDSEAVHEADVSVSGLSKEIEAGGSVGVDLNKTGDSGVDLSAKDEASVDEAVVDSSLAGSSDNVDGRKSPDVKKNNKKLAVSFSVAEPEAGSSDKGETTSALESGVNTTSETGKVEEDEAQNSQVISTSADKDIAKDGQNPDNGGDTGANEGEDSNGTRIGNIVYLPVETDVNGEFTVKSLEVTKDTLSKLSAEEFKTQSKSDSNLADDGSKQVEKGSERIRSSSSSSLGPFSPTPHISAFVNYATGFFQKTLSDNNIKDISEANLDTTPQTFTESTAKKDIPVVASAPTRGKRRGKISRHSNWADVEVESAVSLEEKGDLLTMDYDKFAPRKSMAYPDPPLYLCLRLGTPQNRNLHHNYSIESYGKRRKKSEYWFSIPREKVDHLYAFFVQWSPEIYGDEEDLTAEKRGFVVIEEGEEEDDDELEMLDEHFGPHSAFQKDWEIISASEADKRRSIVFDEPLPLPDLIGESAILTDEHIECLIPEMPGRTIGYPWSLIYSTYKHGFSLKTLYRDMQGLESPILIVVKDTNDQVFGALTSEELKMSDHFYGTGETFLYSFYPEFQIYNWSGDNNFFLKGNQESLSIGAGQGVYGLWFDEDIYHGRTNKCETFNNDLLTLSEDFVVKGFEAWAFV